MVAFAPVAEPSALRLAGRPEQSRRLPASPGVRSLRYIDAPVCRDEDKSGNYVGVAELDLSGPPVGPDFRHNFEVTHQSGTTGRAAVWALSNDLDDVKNWDDDDDQAVSVTLVGAASPTLVLTNHESGASDTSTGLTTQTKYYCTVERTADTTVECRIYSDSARTTLVDTLSVAIASGRTWRYLLGCNSYNDSSADAISFDVENLYACSEDDDRTDYFYNNAWQVVEERKNGSDDPSIQYVWDPRYIDAPVCRDEDKNSDGDCTDAATGIQGSNSGDEHLYYCQDGNYNTTSLVDSYDGAVVERYMYDPYGKVSVRHGVRDAAGNDTSESEWDERTGDTFENEILYCGYRYDTETGLYHVRHRYYHPTLGRWLQRDPGGYADGMSLYEYVRSAPLQMLDPRGYCSCTPEEIKAKFLDKVKANVHAATITVNVTRTQECEKPGDLGKPCTGTVTYMVSRPVDWDPDKPGDPADRKWSKVARCSAHVTLVCECAEWKVPILDWVVSSSYYWEYGHGRNPEALSAEVLDVQEWTQFDDSQLRLRSLYNDILGWISPGWEDWPAWTIDPYGSVAGILGFSVVKSAEPDDLLGLEGKPQHEIRGRRRFGPGDAAQEACVGGD